MRSKILYGLSFFWSCVIAFTLPVCMGWIYMDITGHAKGYGYDLGPEKDIYIVFGFVELLIWLALAVPANLHIFVKTKAKGSRFLPIPLTVFLLLFLLCVYLIGGWAEFGRFFHA